MFDGNVYYCWSCDAHRRAVANAEHAACCPACGIALTEESRLTTRAQPAQIASFILSLPAAPRPARRALSA
jgi:hypothetical protein